MLIKSSKIWEIPERDATPEKDYINRRRFLRGMGLAGLWGVGALSGCIDITGKGPEVKPLSEWLLSEAEQKAYPAQRNIAFTTNRILTEEAVALRFNNFYEFSTRKNDVWKKVRSFIPRPWEITVTGLVHKPQVLDMDQLIRLMPLEERLYRFRCVEAWAMAVPWTGFSLRALIERVEPLSSARYVRFVTFHNPEVAKGHQRKNLPWPYTEGLTIAEATHDLTLLVTGIYGHPLPKQHGAPLRLIVPWKYGFKSIKSITEIEFTNYPPPTFWNTLIPREYGFQANVNPKVPHPRWSQASEKMIGTGKRHATLLYNGYQGDVIPLYS